METLVANISGKIRRDQMDGRDFLVVPVSMIVPGVLNGSAGPILYTPEEVGNKPSKWDHFPVVLDHPVDNDGKAITARDPRILEKTQLGLLFFTKFENKLVSEAWIDIQKTNRIDSALVNRFERGEKVELSTGLGGDLIPAPSGAIHNGVPYGHVAQNIVPDHLAILPNGVIGACSVKDGCGVNNSSKEESGLFDRIKNYFGLTPKVVNEGKDTPVQMTEADKKVHVDAIIANCDCWKDADRATLNSFSDEKIVALRNKAEQEARDKAVAAAATKPIQTPDGGMMTFNSATKAWDYTPPINKDLVDVVDTSSLGVGDTVETVMVGNAKKFRIKRASAVTSPTPSPQSPMTMDEFMKFAPPELKNLIDNSREAENREKGQLVARITNAVTDPTKKLEMIEKYSKKSVSELRDIAELLPQIGNSSNDFNGMPHFIGQNAHPGYFANSNQLDQDDILDDVEDEIEFQTK